MTYLTGSPVHLQFTCIISTVCDQNQVVYCSHLKAHNFAQESPIDKIKVPFSSAINALFDGVLISISTKCGEWVVYTEVTYNLLHKNTPNLSTSSTTDGLHVLS